MPCCWQRSGGVRKQTAEVLINPPVTQSSSPAWILNIIAKHVNAFAVEAAVCPVRAVQSEPQRVGAGVAHG
jgi:hypothetical protein